MSNLLNKGVAVNMASPIDNDNVYDPVATLKRDEDGGQDYHYLRNASSNTYLDSFSGSFEDPSTLLRNHSYR